MKNKKVDVDLDKDIQNTIERNYRKAFNDYHTARENKKIKERRKNKILKILIGVVIVVIVALLLFVNYKMTSNAQKNCIEMGHSENYCYEKL